MNFVFLFPEPITKAKRKETKRKKKKETKMEQL